MSALRNRGKKECTLIVESEKGQEVITGTSLYSDIKHDMRNEDTHE